jgi:hypothetical protein
MHAQRWLTRGLWLLVTVAVGISFVGRPLGMRAGVLAAQQAAQRQAPSGHHAGMPGHAGMPMPCPQHDGQCCAPCLACCAGCITVPAPVALATVIAQAATVRLAGTDLTPVPAARSGGRHLQPPPLGPPTPLVS